MRSTFAGIEIGRTGIMVSQKGLDVTGHNIANVDTPGYTRQRLITTAYDPYNGYAQWKPVEKGLVGSGANVQILDQIRSSFLDRQFRTEQSLFSTWSVRTSGLTYIESLFEGSDASSLSNAISNLFEGFRAFSLEGNDREQRKYLQQEAINLTTSFNLIYERLQSQQQDQNMAVETLTNEINSIADQIAVLNKSIYFYEIDGQPANDLRDKRNLLLDQLSALTSVDYEEMSDGKFVVRIGGEELVNHTNARELACRTNQPNSITGEPDVSVPYWVDSGTDLVISGGELEAHINLRDNASADTPGIPFFMEQLNNLARALAQEVNAVHTQGYTHPASGQSVQGIEFFNPGDNLEDITAGTLKLNQLIIDNEYYIAASETEVVLDGSDPEKMKNGDNNNARNLFNLLGRSDIVLGPPLGTSIGSFNNYLNGIMVDLGTTLKHSKSMYDTKLSDALSVDGQRTSISGVSLDEEMTNLIKYQHAYNGSARVITAMDEAIETIVSKMGLVGR